MAHRSWQVRGARALGSVCLFLQLCPWTCGHSEAERGSRNHGGNLGLCSDASFPPLPKSRKQTEILQQSTAKNDARPGGGNLILALN